MYGQPANSGGYGTSPRCRPRSECGNAARATWPLMRRAERRAWAALPGADGSRDLPPDGPVIHTDRLFAAWQDSRDRRQAPAELTGTVQRGNQNVPHQRSRPAGL
jgi:hypothetical protein